MRTAKPATAFTRDESTESGVRCIEHATDWNDCGCWCEDDQECSSCGEWSNGLHDVPTACPWCGEDYPISEAPQAAALNAG